MPRKWRSSRAFKELGPENQENPANQTEVARIKSKLSGNSTPFAQILIDLDLGCEEGILAVTKFMSQI